MKTAFLAMSALLLSVESIAQTTQWGAPTGNPQFPKENYVELSNPKKPDPAEWNKVKDTKASWVDSDVRYAKEQLPVLKSIKTNDKLIGWKGEQISAQALVWTRQQVESLNYTFSMLKGSKGNIEPSAAFVRYVMQDNFLTCGFRGDINKYDSTLVADVIDPYSKQLPMDAMSVRPIWVTIEIPASAEAGNYTGTLTIKNGEKKIADLKLTVQVQNHTMPEVADWEYHLDFWQNPYAEARYGGFEPFSKDHLEYMRPQYERLRDAGQKVITTSIMHKPWGGQTEDYFESMITWMRRIDGTWAFDYKIFDTWVEYMMEIGIDKQISCYSMIPWNMSFKYYDQRTNSMQEIKTKTDAPEYREMWLAMLKSLSQHLRQKGWFDRTVIAMDERATPDMLNAFRVIKEADPEFKVSLAGGDHPEIEEELYDYCMASDNIFSPETLQKRKNEGQITTYYTCCAQKYPNMFTYSPAAESEWISWFAAAKGYDGYLRWAYNSYTKEPLLDARFRAFQAGDSYLVYPQRTSIRFEKFVDGVEAFEKIRTLRAKYTKENNEKGLSKLDNILKEFEISNFEDGINPSSTLQKARKKLNAL